MNSFVKITLITSAVVLGIGIVIAGIAFASGGLNMKNIVGEIKRVEYNIDDNFMSLNIKCTNSRICICESEDDSCRAVCEENENMPHIIDVTGDTLNIRQTDTRKWYERLWLFGSGKTCMTLYLPHRLYNELKAENISGSISISGSMSFMNVTVANTSGGVELSSEISGDLSVSVTSGGIKLKNVYAENVSLSSVSGSIYLESIQVRRNLSIAETSGKTELISVTADALKIKAVSGKTALTDTTARSSMNIDVVSGKVQLEGCDSADIYIKTVSGKVEAALLSGKQFIAHSTSGRVNVPESVSEGGRCEIETTSGSIDVKVRN